MTKTSAEIINYVENVFKYYFMIGIQLRSQYINDEQDKLKFIRCTQELEENVTKSFSNINP